jgi:hypothetical protein
MIKNNKKGSILYFSVLLVGLLFSAGITTTAILVQKISMIEELTYSTSAFYAADAGIEKALYRWNDISETSGAINYNYSFENLSEDQSYIIRRSASGGNLIITSTGSYKEVRRGIQVSRPIN